MEPLAAVPANNRVRELEAAERHEIDRILRALSAEVGAARHDIVAGVDGLGLLDGLLALARYAETQEAVEPRISPDAGFPDQGSAPSPAGGRRGADRYRDPGRRLAGRS